MRFQPRMLFTLLVIFFAGYAVYTSAGWPLGAKLFPRFVGIPVLILSLIQLVIEAYESMRPGGRRQTDTGDLQVDLGMDRKVLVRRGGGFLLWLLGLFFGIWIFGFFVTIPLYCFFYLKFQAREGWPLSLGLTVGMMIFFVGLFDQILHIAWPEPLIPAPEALIKSLFPALG